MGNSKKTSQNKKKNENYNVNDYEDGVDEMKVNER